MGVHWCGYKGKATKADIAPRRYVNKGKPEKVENSKTVNGSYRHDALLMSADRLRGACPIVGNE